MCRDYAHLAITLLRCLNIPARYCTGYLGDIGVPASDVADGFCGLAGSLHRRRLAYLRSAQQQRRIGRILIARGRDAADVAISTAFGPNILQLFRVWTDEVRDIEQVIGA